MYKHLLLATDLSDENQDTLKKARQMADLYGAKLSIMHAVEPIVNYGYVGLSDIEEQMVEEAKQSLKKIGEELNVTPDDQWIAVGSAKAEIVAIANEIGADLIMMGSHSEHSFTELLGSTTNSVLHQAHCDVVTVRHWKKDR